jgi:predicted hotdog family 3-hydroxylacyl-ACP dehydratase
MTPEQRRERARKAANSRWARPTAQAEQSEATTSALWRRYEYQVDPDGRLPEWRRRELAQHALRAHMADMRLAKARRRQLGEAS